MRVALNRQVQRGVGRIQVAHPGRPVGQPLDPDRAEHRLERALVTRLEAAAYDLLVADDPLQTLLAQRPQGQVIVKQPAQQLPPVDREPFLKLGMREPGGVGSVQEVDQRLELLPAAGRLSGFS